MTTTDSVTNYVESRRNDRDWRPELEALAASALRLAELLDAPDMNGSGAANAARELRLTLNALAPPEDPEPEEPSELDAIIERRRRRLEGELPDTEEPR